MALGVALAADIAGPRQVCQHLRKAHRQLPFQPARLLRPRLSLAWPPPLATLRLRCLRLRRRLLPRLDRRRIPRDVLDKMAIHRPRNQRRTERRPTSSRGCSLQLRWPTESPDACSQDGSRQTRKRPAKTSPRSEAGRHRSSRHAAGGKPAVNLKTAHQAVASECRRGRPRLHASASLPSASAPPSPAPRSPSHREMCSTRWPSIVRAISVSWRFARRLSETRKRPAKTSPRSEAGRHRSSRTAGKACRQPQDARSGRASSECRTPPWL